MIPETGKNNQILTSKNYKTQLFKKVLPIKKALLESKALYFILTIIKPILLFPLLHYLCSKVYLRARKLCVANAPRL